MTVRVQYFTDPGCSASWANEPVVRKLMVEFGAELSWTFVMGGLAREYGPGYEDREAGIGGGQAGLFPSLAAHWLDVAEESRMPFDARLWFEAPISSTYPACMAVKAAAEQASDGGYGYLRAVREGLMCFRRKLDATEALVEEARRVKLDVERFRIDLSSHAVVEAFGSDLDRTRDVPEEARRQNGVKQVEGGERVSFPSIVFSGEDGARHGLFGRHAYEACREAAERAGAAGSEERAPGVLEALRRFGRMATAEVEAVCELPTPRAAAELWELAGAWKVKPVRVLTGYLWEPA